MGTSIEYLGDALEGILTGRIPNLKLKQLLVELYKERAKFDERMRGRDRGKGCTKAKGRETEKGRAAKTRKEKRVRQKDRW